MNRKIFSLVVVLIVSAFFLISCSTSKAPAETAIKAAEQAITATKAEAAKIVPDQVKALDDALAQAKEKFIKGEYKEALAQATPLAAKANEVAAAAKAKKEELTKKWTEISQSVPKMVEDIQAKVDSLAKVRKLPKGLTKETVAEAKAGLTSVKDEWTKAQEIFTAGNITEAVPMAAAIKDKATKIMESLGISAPAPAPAPVPAPATPKPSTKPM